MKPGYKQTEVGVIPEEWLTCRLQDLVDRASPIAYGVLKPGDYIHNGVPLLQIRDVIYGEIDIDQLHRISEELDRQYSRTRLVGGEVVVSLVGTIGRVAILPVSLAGGNLHRNLARIHVSIACNSKFICYFLNSDGAQAAIKLTTFGSSQALLNLADLRNLSVAFPPLPEQRAIATALSDVDGLLGGLDRLIAKKRDLKQAAMQQLLTGQTRLPGFHGEWEVKRLGDVASVSKGNQLHSSETDEGGKFAHLNGGITPSSYTHKSNTDGNTIAISEGGNSCGFVQFMTEPYWCGGHCYSVIPNRVDNLFLYHALKGQQSAIMGLRVGSGLPNVQKTGLLDFKIELPATLPEQTAIASVLTDMDGELGVLEQRREKTRALKQAMMQELLTGKTRLI